MIFIPYLQMIVTERKACRANVPVTAAHRRSAAVEKFPVARIFAAS
jgi:hypothetical protein